MITMRNFMTLALATLFSAGFSCYAADSNAAPVDAIAAQEQAPQQETVENTAPATDAGQLPAVEVPIENQGEAAPQPETGGTAMPAPADITATMAAQ